jgi:hypothetical protein
MIEWWFLGDGAGNSKSWTSRLAASGTRNRVALTSHSMLFSWALAVPPPPPISPSVLVALSLHLEGISALPEK